LRRTPGMGHAANNMELRELLEQRRRWKAAGERVVFTNGCFDLLHPGHVFLLEAARAAGERLVVGINSDASVRALKGPGRPIVSAAERSETLLALESVDRVVTYDEPTPLEIISALVPDVLVKGADWAEDQIVGADVVRRAGGSVVRTPLLPGRSTTSIVDKIRRS